MPSSRGARACLRARQQALTDAKIAWRLPTQMMMLVVRFLAARSLFSLLDLDGFYSVNDCGVRPPQRLYEKRQSESIAWARQRKPCSYRCNDFGRC
jgi:hypothetical protein